MFLPFLDDADSFVAFWDAQDVFQQTSYAHRSNLRRHFKERMALILLPCRFKTTLNNF